MSATSQYDVLFEPVTIGPVTTPNRFYQVPHCTGMGFERPNTLNAMREMNAEGGWGVVCTEFCSIHPSSLSRAQVTLWDDDDVRMLGNMVERVHRHGALAGVQLWYGGVAVQNNLTRETSRAPGSMPLWHGAGQSAAMSKSDIALYRQWHKDAALRARQAGFDIVYVYAGHGYLPTQFLSPVENQRTDEYGGSFENRARLIRELLEDTKDVVGHSMGVAIRYAVHYPEERYGLNVDGEGRDLVEYLAETPDLWDVNVGTFEYDARTSRFASEGAQEEFVRFVKQVTTKPVVGVGRFTSPDTMVSQIRRGVLDLVGAARPSIADPFLPNKIREGQVDAIRECIGCNVCIWANHEAVPLRCTQNATRGEEWRRGWHPERFTHRHADEHILVVGGGPAGLEAARVLGERGYQVTLAEANDQPGGRINSESRLPGFSEWARVRDYRIHAINQMANVNVYRNSHLNADDVLEFGADHICIATGSDWRVNGAGRSTLLPVPGHTLTGWKSVDDVIDTSMTDDIIVYDDDHFYMASGIAEKLLNDGATVTLVTSNDRVAALSTGMLEQERVHGHLMQRGVNVVTAKRLVDFNGASASFRCVHTDRVTELATKTLVSVTSRQPNDMLFHAVQKKLESMDAPVRPDLARIGDCVAPDMVAAAVFAGHRYGRELGQDPHAVLRDRPKIREADSASRARQTG